jgi:hypothetical protein
MKEIVMSKSSLAAHRDWVIALMSEDVLSIAAYLKSLPPVVHRVPGNVSRGEPAEASYVHFGVYQRIV